jgi:hypothetical protein
MTNPSTGGPFAIMALIISLYMLTVGVLLSISKLAVRIAVRFTVINEKLYPVFNKRLYYYASILAIIPVFSLVAQTYDSIDIFEIVLIFAFVILALFYIEKRMI